VCVCHKPVLCQNGWTDPVIFCSEASLGLLYAALYERKFGYLYIFKNKGSSGTFLQTVMELEKFRHGKFTVAECHKQRQSLRCVQIANLASDLSNFVWAVTDRRRWTWPSAVNSRPNTVACWSHSASSFVYSAMSDWSWRSLSRGSVGVSYITRFAIECSGPTQPEKNTRPWWLSLLATVQ